MPRPTHTVAVRHPDTSAFVTLDPRNDFAPDDVLVLAYPWAFAAIEDGHKLRQSVRIEQATAAPGEKRRRSA